MRVHSPNQYLIPAQTWYEAAHWWKVSRVCFKFWRVYKYLNVSWRSTPDFAWCWFEMPILMLNNNQLQLLDGKGIKRRPLAYLIDIYAHGRSFVLARKVVDVHQCENSTILSQVSVVVNLHEEPWLINSTNNHELDNTLIEPHRDIYLVEFYW